MTSEQFEIYIATFYEDKGYTIKLTPKSYDYGVDVIASNQKEKIAIQVKMYDTRLVNYKDIMYLYAGKNYYDCDKGILITTGFCHPLAIKVANKLGIEIFDDFKIEEVKSKVKSINIIANNSDFDEIWNKFIIPLKGQTIFTASGMKNIIIDVNNDFLKRQSSTGEYSKIEKQIFKTVYHRLLEKKSITRDEINTEYTKRGSAIITVVLAVVPFIKLSVKPKIKLIIEN